MRALVTGGCLRITNRAIILAGLKLAPPVRELHQDVAGTFKDTYLLDFLNLPEPHLVLVNISH